jgi:hypothetical protein
MVHVVLFIIGYCSACSGSLISSWAFGIAFYVYITCQNATAGSRLLDIKSSILLQFAPKKKGCGRLLPYSMLERDSNV